MKALYAKYSARGFDIVAFPCGQFLGQELSCDMDIKAFAVARNIQFTMMSKVDAVNGEEEHPVYAFLKAQPGCDGPVRWNFHSKSPLTDGAQRR